MRMKHPVHGFHVPMPGERESMLKNGWVDEVPDEALPTPSSGKPVVVEDDIGFVGLSRLELEAKARQLGIKFSPLIGDATLAERIEKAA